MLSRQNKLWPSTILVSENRLNRNWTIRPNALPVYKPIHRNAGSGEYNQVVHDWGSVIGLDYARQNEKNIAGVVFMEAIIPPSFPMAAPPGGPDGLFAKFRTPDTGKDLLITQNVFVEQNLIKGALTRTLTEAEANTYRAPFVDPEKRFPIYVWPNELPIAGKPSRNVKVINEIGAWLKSAKTPKLLQYVSPGATIPPSAAEWMAVNYANIETQFVGYGRHFIQEDNPERRWSRRLVSS